MCASPTCRPKRGRSTGGKQSICAVFTTLSSSILPVLWSTSGTAPRHVRHLVQGLRVELQLFLKTFVVDFGHDLQRPHVVELRLVQLCGEGALGTLTRDHEQHPSQKESQRIVTIDNVLFLDFVFLQQFQELLLHGAAPRVGFQIFSVALKLSHQLAVHHLRTFAQTA